MTEIEMKQLQQDLEAIADEMITDALTLVEQACLSEEPVYPGRPVWTRALFGTAAQRWMHNETKGHRP